MKPDNQEVWQNKTIETRQESEQLSIDGLFNNDSDGSRTLNSGAAEVLMHDYKATWSQIEKYMDANGCSYAEAFRHFGVVDREVEIEPESDVDYIKEVRADEVVKSNLDEAALDKETERKAWRRAAEASIDLYCDGRKCSFNDACVALGYNPKDFD